MNTASLKRRLQRTHCAHPDEGIRLYIGNASPKLEKIVLNQGLKLAVSDKKIIEVAINEMTTITGQKGGCNNFKERYLQLQIT